MAYPDQIVRIMRPQIENVKRTAMHHLHNRHDGRGSRPARQWIAEVRRIDKASGYSEALRIHQSAMKA